MDPWLPQTKSSSQEVNLQPCPTQIHYFRSSDEYISSLENKLNKLRGRTTQEVKSQDMIRSLSEAREAHMQRHLSSASDSQYSSHFTDDDAEALDDNSTLAQLHRRLHPERQALTTEELKALVEHDQLESVAKETEEEHDIKLETQNAFHSSECHQTNSSVSSSGDTNVNKDMLT